MLKRHLPNLLTYFRHRITYAMSEGFNSNGPVHLVAHSMGNVVAAEALRLWSAGTHEDPLVTTYSALEGALSAGAYGDDSTDGTDTPPADSLLESLLELLGGTASPSETDLYRNWPTGVTGGESRFYMQGTVGAAGKWINFYNSVDYATSVLWKANNIRKPITGPYWVNGFAQSPSGDPIRYLVDDDGRIYRGWGSVSDGTLENEVDLTPGIRDGVSTFGVGPTAYEVLGLVAKSNSLPIGTKVVDFFTGGNFDIASLGLPGAFDDKLAGHSFQYNFDAATTSPFWERLVQEAGLAVIST